jgi:hypothetical protein
LLYLGRLEEAIAESAGRGVTARAMAMLALGRSDEAVAQLDAGRAHYSGSGINAVGALSDSVQLSLKGDVKGATEVLLPTFDLFPDAEGHFLLGRWLARIGAVEESIALLERSRGRFNCAHSFLHDPWLESVRSDPRFVAILASVVEESERSLTAYLEAGGPEVLEAGSTDKRDVDSSGNSGLSEHQG